jgi:dihydroflavonol-4-reductase
VLDVADHKCLPDGVDFRRGSILDAAALEQAMAGVQHVYHIAGIPHMWVREKTDYARVNSEGTERVLDLAQRDGVERVVHCSTEAILMPRRACPDTLIDEDNPPPFDDMPGPYTQSKHKAEQVALMAVAKGLDVCLVNPTIPIGPHDSNMTPPAAMLATFMAGKSPVFLDCVLNIVDVRDVAAGMILAAEHGRTGERYILGGENLSLRDVLGMLETTSGRRMPKHTLPAGAALAAAHITEWLADRVTGKTPAATREGVRLALRSAPLDSGKARRELGYAPRPIGEALTATVQWLAARM